MYEYKALVTRVVDGDTFDAEVDLGFHVKVKHRFRLMGIDTPETYRPQNEAELQHGLKAKALVQTLIEGQQVTLRSNKIGIYGRWNAQVEIFGKDLARILKGEGMEKRDKY